MKQLLCNVFLGLMLTVSVLAVGIFDTNEPDARIPIAGSQNNSLDDAGNSCTLDYLYPVNGAGRPGAIQWPGGNASVVVGMYEFNNSCTPQHSYYAYCMDLDHTLYTGPYCTIIGDAVINPLYPEQYPAMGYILTWFSSALHDTLSDDIQQVSLWKLSSDGRSWVNGHANPNLGKPYYRIPTYPSLNTVFYTIPSVNHAANQRDSIALGLTDGIPKNIIMCGDHLQVSIGNGSVLGNDISVNVFVQLERGTDAASAGNLSRSGVRLNITNDIGVLSRTEAYTDSSGRAEFQLTRPRNSTGDAHVIICSRGAWPQKIAPCEAAMASQILVAALQSAKVCSVCVDPIIPADHFLPTELAAFDAASVTNGIQLSWRTAAETGLQRWSIERRESHSDFAIISQIPAVNSATGNNYHFVDQAVQTGVSYFYRLNSVDMNGNRFSYDDAIHSASWNSSEAIASNIALLENYPNPFNPETTIRFQLNSAGFTTLKVYDIVGKEVATLIEKNLIAGTHQLKFHAENLPTGLYFYTLNSSMHTEIRKMILLK